MRPPVASPLQLYRYRIEAVTGWVREWKAASVGDFGCGEGQLLSEVASLPHVTRVVVWDSAREALKHAKRVIDEAGKRRAQPLSCEIIQGSLLNPALAPTELAVVVLMEVLEHIPPEKHAVLEQSLFRNNPTFVIVTTPNREYNQNFKILTEAGLRHVDHRFEWTRQEFERWTNSVAKRFGYACELTGLGPYSEDHGHPTQVALFQRN